jgi:hypothetical protein
MICLENCEVMQAKTWEGQSWVLNFKIEEFNEFACGMPVSSSQTFS